MIPLLETTPRPPILLGREDSVSEDERRALPRSTIVNADDHRVWASYPVGCNRSTIRIRRSNLSSLTSLLPALRTSSP